MARKKTGHHASSVPTEAGADNAVVNNILEVALEEFAAHGLAGARVDAIAARTRTSKRMLYYHFGSKEGLYGAVLARAYADMHRHPEPAGLATQPPLQALRLWVGHVFDTHARHPLFVRLVMGENLLGAQTLRQLPQVRASNQLGLASLSDILRRGKRSGDMRHSIQALDVYANVVALSFHFVSNRATFSTTFQEGQAVDAQQRSRRRCIIDTIERQVQAQALPAPVAARVRRPR